jgi:hypothetical protein
MLKRESESPGETPKGVTERRSNADASGFVIIVELVEGQDVSGSSHIEVPLVGDLQNFVGCSRHHFLETTVHDILLFGSFQETLLGFSELLVSDLSGFLDDLDEVLL